MLDHAQFMGASAERRILCNDDPFAVCIGLILDQLLIAIEQDDVAASTGGDGAGTAGELAAGLAAWLRMAGSPRQASPRTAAVTTAPAAISQRTVRGITLLTVRLPFAK
jgi:hypothetical protein